MAVGRKCSVLGCNKPHEARGFCNGHYIQWKKFGRVKRASLMRDKNRFIQDEGFYRIELLDIEGNFVGEALIDLEDYEKCRNIKWHLGKQGYAQNIKRRIKLHRNNTSGYIGVCWHKKAGKWTSYVKDNGRQRYLGLFEGQEEAARIRDAEALKLFGEFAVLNFC